jgi:hypothetical protein
MYLGKAIWALLRQGVKLALLVCESSAVFSPPQGIADFIPLTLRLVYFELSFLAVLLLFFFLGGGG